MPNYPTGSQNQQLLEDLKEQYSQYLPGFQGSQSSVVDFMKHLGTQGVEGMGHDKENRAKLLGLNKPSGQIGGAGMPTPIVAPTSSDQAFPTMDYLNILTGQSPRGPRNDLETQNLAVPEIAPRQEEETFESAAAEPNWGDGRFNLPELAPNSGAINQNDLTSLLSEKFTPTKKELSTSLYEKLGTTDLGKQFEEGIGSTKLGFKEKLGSLFAKGQGKIGAMQEKLAPLDKKLTDLMGKSSEISAKFAGPLEAAQMWAGGDEAGKATENALKKVNEGFTNLHGMRGSAIQGYDDYMDIAEDQFKSTIAQQGSLSNKALKDAKGKATSNIGTGSIQKSVLDIRSSLASGMKHTVDASKAKLDAAGLKGMARRRGEMENITEATDDLKIVKKELKKKLKVEKLVGGIDKAVAGGTLALDFMTGGTAGSAVRGGYSIGKRFLGV